MEDVSQETNNAETSAGKERVIGRPFPKGVSGNPAGRPKGSISPIARVKQIFEEKPEQFEAFITEYITDPANRKHIVEMIDGKPLQNTDITSNGESITPILVKFIDNEDNRNPEGV
jgi:uncharacterized protein YeaO (DUF488 family)